MNCNVKVFGFVLIMGVLFDSSVPQAQQKHSFEIKGGQFLYDQQPIKIYSGEMHYPRIPKEYWKHRLQMVKAMGMNTVSTYVFWNYHETAPGVWDFKTGNHNLRQFVQLAGKEGLHVILRPGPYVCAEWEFGGYPWWLQNNKALEIRTNNQPYLDSCKIYFDHLMAEVKDLQISHGGPVILFQSENEFGSYVYQRQDISPDIHKAYNTAIKNMLLKAGVTVPLFTSDGSGFFYGGAIDGVLPTSNGEDDVVRLKKVVEEYNAGKGPYLIGEFYPGWLTHWTEPIAVRKKEGIVSQTKKYLDAEVSFNYYVVHGGTNFGFSSGANYTLESPIQPDITSYDYDAPISEGGVATEKYSAIRELMKSRVDYEVPEIPAAIPVIAIPAIRLTKAIDFMALQTGITPVTSTVPKTFEELGQGHGYVLYRRQFGKHIKGELLLNGLRDYATVYVNGKRVGVLNRMNKSFSMPVDIPVNGVLELLVENMGRINYGAEIVHNLKGIISPVLINGMKITGGWNMYQFPMDTQPDIKQLNSESSTRRPAVYSGEFHLTKTGDTYLDMQKWGKGIVYVNGHHLGRYWSVGPQQTLYLPGVWLNKGKNVIVVFEQLNDVPQHTVEGLTEPILNVLHAK